MYSILHVPRIDISDIALSKRKQLMDLRTALNNKITTRLKLRQNQDALFESHDKLVQLAGDLFHVLHAGRGALALDQIL